MTVRDEQTARRVDFAFQQLLDHRPTSRITADLAKREGLSIRQASEYTREAFRQLTETLEQVDRPHLAARSIAALEAVMEQGIATGQLSAVVGAARQLDALLALSPRGAPWRPPDAWKNNAHR